MNENMSLVGKKVILRSMNNDLWHEYYKNYVNDPLMDSTPYVYDKDRIEKAYQSRINDSARLYFVIMLNSEIIGNIYLKHINWEKKEAEFGIALVDDSAKGKGYGTEAIRLLLDYSFNDLKLNTIYADSVLRNNRSQHILDKLGFQYTHEDSTFKYYKIEKRA